MTLGGSQCVCVCVSLIGALEPDAGADSALHQTFNPCADVCMLKAKLVMINSMV
jgi:hypothetical protein